MHIASPIRNIFEIKKRSGLWKMFVGEHRSLETTGWEWEKPEH